MLNTQPISRNTEIVIQDLENELLVYDLKTNKAFCLNETSFLVFRLCNGTRTIAEISNEMSEKLKKTVSEDLVWLALEGLKKNGLLENADELTNHFAGMTRREAVRKVGFASMIALPIISSVVAPNAAMAGSATLANGQACSPGQCVSGNCRPVTSGPSPACCAATTTENPARPPGNLGGCFTLADCNTSGPQRCCSGSATAAPEPGCAGGINPAETFSCTCNSY